MTCSVTWGWVKRGLITVRSISWRFSTCTNFFCHCFWHMFDNLHWNFIANLFRNWGANFFGNFPGNIDRVFDTYGFRKIFASFSRDEDRKILAFFLRHFFAFGTRYLLLNLDWDLKLTWELNMNCSFKDKTRLTKTAYCSNRFGRVGHNFPICLD